MTSFSDLALLEPIKRALTADGYTTPTPIQEQTIPALLDGHDLLGLAQTGTGKTAAFALPILHRLASARQRAAPRHARVLVLAPTRELAVQIDQSFARYGRHLPLSHLVVVGGTSMRPQVQALGRGVDLLVATPGRLLDLVDQGHVKLDRLDAFVLDEADRMFDMGFIHALRRIASLLPSERQTLMFSATMPKEVEALAESLLRDPVRVSVAPQQPAAERVEQQLMFVEKSNKRNLLLDLLAGDGVDKAIVFMRTKHTCDRLADQLDRHGLAADSIHGDKEQRQRQRALSGFKQGRLKVLVATDIAARGIDVTGVSHVVNFDLPNDPESYVHRIGRTARNGAEGIAISFCGMDEVEQLMAIEKVLKDQVPDGPDHAYHAPSVAAQVASRRGAMARGRRPGGGNRDQSRRPGGRSRKPGGGRPGSHGNDRAAGSRAAAGGR